jgi:hypothetical protein
MVGCCFIDTGLPVEQITSILVKLGLYDAERSGQSH